MKFNSLDEIFEDNMYFDGETYECPVCGKTYKSKSAAFKHHNDRACHSVVDMFINTSTEATIRSIGNAIMGAKLGRRKQSMSAFRKTKLYKQIAETMIYNVENDINDIEHYIMWGFHEIKTKDLWKVFNFLLKDRLDFKDYFSFKREVVTDQDQDRFFGRNHDRLISDKNFMIRNVEKGNLTFTYISAHVNMESFFRELNSIQTERVRNLL